MRGGRRDLPGDIADRLQKSAGGEGADVRRDDAILGDKDIGADLCRGGILVV